MKFASDAPIQTIPDTDLIAQIAGSITRHQSFVVVSHLDPDGDALGTTLAVGSLLKSLGKTVFLVRDSVIPPKYQFLPGITAVVEAASLPDSFMPDCFIVLECPQRTRIGTATRFLNASDVINIDHHRGNERFGTINWVNLHASSVGEMVCELFQQMDCRIDAATATCLFTAVLTDTGRFRYDSTTPRTFEIAGKLVAAGANPRAICDAVYFQMPIVSLRLLGALLGSMEMHENNQICLLSMTQEMTTQLGLVNAESEGFVEYTLYGEGVLAGVLLKEKTDQLTKASIRSNGSINAAAVASQFGGGGHLNAAGCQLQMPIREAKAALLAALSRELRDHTI